MAVVLVEVDVARLTGCELAALLLAAYRRIPVVNGDMVADRVVAPVDFVAEQTAIALFDDLDVLLVAAPA